MHIQEFERRFNESIVNLISSKRGDNSSLLTGEQYVELVEKVKGIKCHQIKDKNSWRFLKTYDVLTLNGHEKLVKPVNAENTCVVRYVATDELFQIIHETHSAIGHGGRNRMMYELKKKYCNITKESVMKYLKLCTVCQKKATNKKRGLVSKPILQTAFNSRAQIDLIDMQSQEFNGFRFIMVYQDHFTKFVLLRPLQSKRATEIALQLYKIYTPFGAPAILQSDNGREFVNSVINELHAMWPGVKIVHGRPRHSQSQGSVERANRDIEEMISAWTEENQSPDWPNALDAIQFQKNRALHSGIGRSPFEAMFGCTAQTGILSLGLPAGELDNIITEADLEEVLRAPGMIELNDEVDSAENQSSPAERCTQDLNEPSEIIEHHDETTVTGNINEPDEDTDHQNEASEHCDGTPIGLRLKRIRAEREKSKVCLEKQAKKMMKHSSEKLGPVAVGTSVRVPIPDVDRAKGSPRNVLAVVINVDDNNSYELGNLEGFFDRKYSRSDFFPCSEQLIDLSSVLKLSDKKKISIRQAAATNSIFGAQGFDKCNCKQGCNSNRCKCFKNNKLCNSKCHSSLTCQNKHED